MLPKDNLTEEFANRWGWEKSFGQRLGCFSLADKLSLDDFMNPAIPVRKTIWYLIHYNVCIGDDVFQALFKSCVVLELKSKEMSFGLVLFYALERSVYTGYFKINILKNI
jgi:hypothetical protein